MCGPGGAVGVRRGCSRSHARARLGRRDGCRWVVTSGSPQGGGVAKDELTAMTAGPPPPARQMRRRCPAQDRSERMRISTTTGMSLSKNAKGRRSRHRPPAGPPDRQCPAATRRCTTPAHLPRGHRCRIRARPEPHRVQRRGPRATPGLQRDDHRVKASPGPSCADPCRDRRYDTASSRARYAPPGAAST